MARQEIPEYQRQTAVAGGSGTPDYSSATRELAANSNFLSSIGATVAQSASQTMATKLGYQMGQTPQGDLLPPITDFDRTMANAYHTQASATLSLQAQKLMLDSDVEMSRATRLTPSLIARTNQQVGQGLESILKNAPTEVRGQLQANFASQLMTNNHQYQVKMIGQQREDQKNTMIAGMQLMTKNAFEQSVQGHVTGKGSGSDLAEQAKAMAKSAYDMRFISPAEAQGYADAAKQASFNGRFINGAIEAKHNGTYEQYLKNYAENKPKDMSFTEWETSGAAGFAYMNNLDALKSKQEALTMAQFNTQLVENPNTITPTDFNQVLSELPPIKQEEAKVAYIKAMRSYDKNKGGTEGVIANFNNVEFMANATPEHKNEAFESIVTDSIQKAADKGIALPRYQAEYMAAAVAGGQIPAYKNIIKAKLQSTDPQSLEEAVEAVDYMNRAKKAQNLGLEPADLAVGEVYKTLRQQRGQTPPTELAQMAYDAVHAKSNEQLQANKIAVDAYITSQKGKNQSSFNYFKQMAGIPNDAVVRNLPNYVDKATHAFYDFYNLTNGDEVTSQRMTQDWLRNNFGITNVNGSKEWTEKPLEQTLNLPDNAMGYVHSDITEQLNDRFKSQKEAFDNGQADWWFEAVQPITYSQVETATKRVQSITERLNQPRIWSSDKDALERLNLQRELRDNKKLINQYSEGSPIKVVQHFRHDEYQTSKFETPLTQKEEVKFQEWKRIYAPNDSGVDYDLRGAFKAGLKPDEKTGHWPDTFKKPNHPTFSDQSKYAALAPQLAGKWEGDTYIPSPSRTSVSGAYIGSGDIINDVGISANSMTVSTGNPDQPMAGGYDIMIKTDKGMKSLYSINPMEGIPTYSPRVKQINDRWAKTHTKIDTRKFDLAQMYYQPKLKGMLEPDD